ncbi:MAG: C25 family cysteine peptidase, partial [Candidatus Kapaibacteriota bacterium]
MNKLLLRIFFFTIPLLTIHSQTPKEELEKIVQSYEIPYDYKWYEPTKIYVKLITNKDKIYYIEADSIFTIENYFNGKPHKYLHLIHKSQEIPVYIHSSNEFFDSGDTLIFLGSRPAGDTTWFDPFSSYEVFYLYFDQTKEGLRFANFDNTTTPTRRIDFINVRYHFEEHHKYSIGQPETSSQTVGGEGWVWELLSPSDEWIKQESFKLGINFYPWIYPDSATFRFFFLSAKFDSNSTRHNITISINNEIAFNQIFEPGKNILAEFKYPIENLFLGNNFLEIENKGSFKSPGVLALPDVVGFQYFEYHSKDIPFARDGFVSCYFNEENSNTSVEISNLRNPKAYLIDTTSQRLSILNSVPSIAFWVNLLDNDLRISINDSILTSNQKGLHLVAYDSASGSIKYSYFTGENNKPIAEIRNLSNNSVYIVVFNGNKISNDVVKFFKIEGSSSVQRTKDDYRWIFARKIGSEEKYENTNNRAKLSLFGKFFANYSSRYTIILNLPQIEKTHHFYISDASALEQAIVKQVLPSNLYDTLQQADVIVVCPKIFEEVATKYIDYRKSTNTEKTFILALTEDIYKEFNYGKKSPWAIKRFLAWAYNKWQKPKPEYLVLIGDANFDTRNVLEGSIYKDFVPTFGWPPIDAWYSYLEGNDFVSDIHVGRIPIKTIQEGYDYLEKIKEYDEAQTSPWMKNFLFLSGGENYLEREYFYDRLKGDFADYILGLSPICAHSKVIRKSDEIVGSEADASFIRAAINEGVTFMLFAGHGSAKVFDTDGWKVQTLNNKGKYGFFSSFSCNTANFAEPTLVCRNEEYTLFPEKGFVATIGSVEVSIRLYSLILASHLLTTIADSNFKTDYMVAL